MEKWSSTNTLPLRFDQIVLNFMRIQGQVGATNGFLGRLLKKVTESGLDRLRQLCWQEANSCLVHVENHRDRHRLRRVRVFDDVDFSDVSSNRQRAGIDAHGFVRGRVTTSGTGGRDAQPVTALAGRDGGRVADGGAGAGYGYHLRRRIHSLRGVEGDSGKLNEDWIAYRDYHGNGHLASRRFHYLLSDVGTSDESLSGQSRVGDGYGVRSGVSAGCGKCFE